MLEDEFDGLRTATRLGSQFIQAHLENVGGVCTADDEYDQSTLTLDGCENSPANDNPSKSSQVDSQLEPVPIGQQPTLSRVTAHPTGTFTFTFSSSSSARPTHIGQKGGRCFVCMKALCPCRHECNGSVNHAWCMHGHPPLGANEKIQWSEAEVKCRITAASTGYSN